MWATLDPHWALGVGVVVLCLLLISFGHGADTVKQVMMTMVGWLIGRSSKKK